MADLFAQMISQMKSEKLMYPAYVDLPTMRVFTVFFPSKSPNAPVLIYNPGGPGGSGLDEIFSTFSPYIFVTDENGNGRIERNTGDHNITSRYNLLYLDFPGDTGYSISKTGETYGDAQSTEIATRTIKAILKMYNLSNRRIDFFGFSYAGKIWPLVAESLLKQGYNIGGLAIFSGYSDPLRQEIRPLITYLYYLGILTSSEYQHLESMAKKIEQLLKQDPSGKNWRSTQDLYLQTVTEAWDDASADTYNVARPLLVERPIEKPSSHLEEYNIHITESKIVDIPYRRIATTGPSEIEKIVKQAPDEENEEAISYLSTPVVQRAMGVIGTSYHDNATTFDISTYEGFLNPVTSSLKYLADHGVLILYFMGSLDGATLAKGTMDMMENTFNTKITEKQWIVTSKDIPSVSGMQPVLIGRISRIAPNVYYGTVIGSGHSMQTPEGVFAFTSVMNYLYNRRGPTL